AGQRVTAQRSGDVPGRPSRSLATLLPRAAVLGLFGHRLAAAPLAALATAEAALDRADRLTSETCAALAVAIAHAVRSGGPASEARRAAPAWADAASAAPILSEALAALGPTSARALDATPAPLRALNNAFTPALGASSLEDGVARACLQSERP